MTPSRHRAARTIGPAALLLLGTLQALAAPAGDALDRPAVAVRQVERAVLIGAAQAGPRLVAVGERGLVALSDDGLHWTQAPTPVSVTLTAVRFADATHGVAVGHGGTVLATSDGGRSWTRKLDGRRLAQIALETARAANDARALKEAERLVAEGADKPLLDLLMLDAQRWIVVGAYGFAFATDDGGAHWASWMPRLDNPKGLHLYTLRRQGDTLLMAGEQGLVLLSQDGGRSFRRVETPYKGSIFSAEFTAANEIVLAGLRGQAWRSADGGASWAALASPMPVSITATALAADGALLAANQAGFVMALRGDRFVPLNRAPLPPLNGLLPRAGAPLLALGVQGVAALDLSAGTPK
ncbi:WD40/YVTN/BNR-like repeat-containing protein [Aquabacterium sp.]|uniref:WD40/YVTN/BNR-like repeat-containing protein n=1 Tax=Aquabacterium sp. TaxID=1872578 RepID=UPI003784F8F9